MLQKWSQIWRFTQLLAFILCLAQIASKVNGAAVMSVDLGSEWMKVGVVSPGVPMEIALNKESKRKTPTVLAFRDGTRTFGEDAQTAAIRDPTAAYAYLLDLLGKTVDNPIVDLYRSRFPYYNITADQDRGTVVFNNKGDNTQFSVEELIAQILMKAKEFAEDSTRQKITECVLVVPGFFGQPERTALLSAAQLANLKVLQLINDYTAIALNYGVFHRAEINETAQYFVFYDMGAYKTSAAVVSFQLAKDKLTKETSPVIQVHGVGYDRTLGGLEIQLRLRDHLAVKFNDLKKTKTDVTKNPRALAKLFKEAGRLKNVLSANADHYAQIENLLEDHDFKLLVTREDLESLCSDLWPRIVQPLNQAIKASGLSLDIISQVIILGGGTRMPKVQEILKDAIKQELGKSLNADEAATMGAVYKAADLATGFKVKRFIIKDAVIFPIHVSFDRDQGDGSNVKQVKRVLFGHMNSYPQKKVITFSKHVDDFDFSVHYSDLSHLSENEIAYLGGLNISRVKLEKVKEILEKNQKEAIEGKGFKAHFILDDSGIFKSTGIEYVWEKHAPTEELDKEGTLAKLGNSISKLFSKGNDESKKAEENVTKEEKQQQQQEEEQQQQQQKEGKEDISSNATAQDNATDNTTTTKQEDKVKMMKNDTMKTVTIKEPVVHQVDLHYTQPLSGESLEKSSEKLAAINQAEYERRRLETAFNNLESHVIEIQEKLSNDDYGSCASEDEKKAILDECNQISNWLYEDRENENFEDYEKRLDNLKQKTDTVLGRHWEHEERPEALKSLKAMISEAGKFLASAENLTKEVNPEKDVFTRVEIETLATVIQETGDWMKKEGDAQKKLKRYEEIRITVKDITDKMALLDREVKYLVNKIKIWKPKTKPTPSPSAEEIPKQQQEQQDDGEKIESGSGGNSEEEQKEQMETVETIESEEFESSPPVRETKRTEL